jgi:hypothetical protein
MRKLLFFPMFFVFFCVKLHVNGSLWKGLEVVKKCPGQESNLRPSA